MPSKIDPFWRERVFTLFANERGLSSTAIEARVRDEASHLRRIDWPGDRTIRRLRKEWATMPEALQQHYRFLHWPEAMEGCLLPWDASRAVLDLLQYFNEEYPGVRPLLGLAKWFWRITQSAPDMGVEERAFVAEWFMLRDMGVLPSPEVRRVEYYLAYAPWRSGQAHLTYAKQTGPEWPGDFAVGEPPLTTDANLAWLLTSGGPMRDRGAEDNDGQQAS